MNDRTVRVRMAPSPTGNVHVGSARTALYNLLYARSHGGRFVLRLDDTDLQRNRAEYEAAVYDGLRWLGLEWDEGPDVGGPHAPYRQSERLDIYRQHAVTLLDSGQAYRCFCTPEELDAERRAAEAEKRAPVYSRRCLNNPPAGRSVFAVRFKVPGGDVTFDDLIRGDMRFDSSLIGDFIIVKSDGYPTYNFASPIDDALMQTTHVIRGEEHLPNTPVQLLVLDALGLPRPQAFAHIPLILAPDRTKLSKRRHAVYLSHYRELGYLPEAMVNYLALLGWNPGTEQEIFTLEQLVEIFDLSRVHRGGAIFDQQKLDWINGHYIRSFTVDELARRLKPFLPELDEETIKRAAPALQERMTRLADARELLAYLWTEPDGTHLDPEAAARARTAADALAGVEWTPDAIESSLEHVRQMNEWSRNQLFKPIREAVTGRSISPPIHYTLALLPKDDALRRLHTASS